VVTISRRKKVLFAIVAMSLSTFVMLGAVLAADLYVHHRAEKTAGLNRWGYRGPVLGRKQPDEVRISFLGGSTTFGYGVPPEHSIPAQVGARLNGPAGHVTTANLGMNNSGAYSFLFTLQDYAYLDPDIVVLYEGYNDHLGDAEGGNRHMLRHDSAVFRLTGYYPILPLVLSERAMLLRYGDLATAYEAKGGIKPKAVFRPGLAQRTAAGALETAVGIGESVSRQIDRVSPRRSGTEAIADESGCPSPWALYCQWIYRATQYALSRGWHVAIASQPAAVDGMRDEHARQQIVLIDMVRRKFGGNPQVIHVDLRGSIDLNDQRLSFDLMHLTQAGNGVAADHLADALRPLVAARLAAR
jgi:lysophospholipase L1-like esterase